MVFQKLKTQVGFYKTTSKKFNTSQYTLVVKQHNNATPRRRVRGVDEWRPLPRVVPPPVRCSVPSADRRLLISLVSSVGVSVRLPRERPVASSLCDERLTVADDDIPPSAERDDRAQRPGGSGGRRPVHGGARRFRHGPPATPLREPQAAARGRRRPAPGAGQRTRRRRRGRSVAAEHDDVARCNRRHRQAQVVVLHRGHRGSSGRAAAPAVRRAVVGNRHPPAAQKLCRLCQRVVQPRRKGTNTSTKVYYGIIYDYSHRDGSRDGTKGLRSPLPQHLIFHISYVLL